MPTTDLTIGATYQTIEQRDRTACHWHGHDPIEGPLHHVGERTELAERYVIVHVARRPQGVVVVCQTHVAYGGEYLPIDEFTANLDGEDLCEIVERWSGAVSWDRTVSDYLSEVAPDPEQQRRDADAWRREIAMEAGMLHGIDAYNDAMGQSVGSPHECGHHCDCW